MKRRARLLLLILSVSAPLLAEDCFFRCMELSGCWSGRSVSDPASCNNMPQLCTIRCQGQSNNSWGAIAYSKPDKISGWSFEQSDSATANHTALQFCTKQGGVKCQVEASFNHSCGAVAADGDFVAWGTSGAKVSAQQRATAECVKMGGKKCAVEASVCSSPNASSSASGTPPAPKAVAWGAIAYSVHDMGAGWSQGKPDRASAEKEALAACSQRGKDCVLQTAFNKQCGALAGDRTVTGFAAASDQRQANQQAIDACKKSGGAACALHISFCSQ